MVTSLVSTKDTTHQHTDMNASTYADMLAGMVPAISTPSYTWYTTNAGTLVTTQDSVVYATIGLPHVAGEPSCELRAGTKGAYVVCTDVLGHPLMECHTQGEPYHPRATDHMTHSYLRHRATRLPLDVPAMAEVRWALISTGLIGREPISQ